MTMIASLNRDFSALTRKSRQCSVQMIFTSSFPQCFFCIRVTIIACNATNAKAKNDSRPHISCISPCAPVPYLSELLLFNVIGYAGRDMENHLQSIRGIVHSRRSVEHLHCGTCALHTWRLRHCSASKISIFKHGWHVAIPCHECLAADRPEGPSACADQPPTQWK